MNRRNFFGTVGAVIAGAVLGRNGPSSELSVDATNGMRLWDGTHRFITVDGITLGSFESHINIEQDGFGDAVIDLGEHNRKFRTLYAAEMVVDAAWYDAWL